MSNIENKNVNKDTIYDENNGLYYTKIGDYYYPNIVVNNTVLQNILSISLTRN